MSGTKMSLTPELVALTLKPVPDEGPEPRWNPIQEDELDALVRRVTEESNNEPLWIFAYGSLIWNPDFDFDMKEVGTVYGWHRSFSVDVHTKDGKRKALPFWASSPSHQFTTPLSLDCAVTIREHF